MPYNTYDKYGEITVKAGELISHLLLKILKVIKRRLTIRQASVNPWTFKIREELHFSLFIELFKAVWDNTVHPVFIEASRDKRDLPAVYTIKFNSHYKLVYHRYNLTKRKIHVNSFLTKTVAKNAVDVSVSEYPCCFILSSQEQ